MSETLYGAFTIGEHAIDVELWEDGYYSCAQVSGGHPSHRVVRSQFGRTAALFGLKYSLGFRDVNTKWDDLVGLNAFGYYPNLPTESVVFTYFEVQYYAERDYTQIYLTVHTPTGLCHDSITSVAASFNGLCRKLGVMAINGGFDPEPDVDGDAVVVGYELRFPDGHIILDQIGIDDSLINDLGIVQKRLTYLE